MQFRNRSKDLRITLNINKKQPISSETDFEILHL